MLFFAKFHIMNKINVLFEDNHIIVVNKPSGVLSQKDDTGDDSILEMVKAYIKEKYNKPYNVFLGLVHRLDRPASGVMVLAKTSKALTRLNNSLRDKGFEKKYYAIVEGMPQQSSGQLRHHIKKDKAKNRVKLYDVPTKGAKEAILNYNVLYREGNYSLIDVDLITGRPHQIRSQLAQISVPIVGDLKYNSKVRVEDKSICLHCYRLKIMHPVKKEFMIFNGLPDFSGCLWRIFKKNLI